jgi:uncharacterized protein DUF5996
MHPVAHEPWPALPLTEWRDTYTTLHRWLQMVGKTRLALAPMQNHWWQVVLYVTTRGLGTSPMPVGERSLEIELDFVDHQLIARTTDGETRAFALTPMSVADFYGEYLEMLRALDVAPRIRPVPVEMADVTPFTTDREHASYDPGGIPNCPDYVTREAYSHECISAGWWPGAVGSPIEEPAFYAYAYPEPAGCSTAPIGPADASYHTTMHEWILPYEAVRKSSDPGAMVLEFLESTYAAAATRGGWDRGALER